MLPAPWTALVFVRNRRRLEEPKVDGGVSISEL